jgi:hypothetical protein
MTIRDREVLEELRDDPGLLALADALVETQRIRRRFRPWGAVTVVALVAGLLVLLLASPWGCSPASETLSKSTTRATRA